MTLEGHPIDQRGMAGTQIGRHAYTTLQHTAVGIVDDLDLAVELLAHLGRPFLAASATRITMHGDI
ncbi:hypothetical protein ACNJI7_21305, partial [Mycobacterium tuberculosis]